MFTFVDCSMYVGCGLVLELFKHLIIDNEIYLDTYIIYED